MNTFSQNGWRRLLATLTTGTAAYVLAVVPTASTLQEAIDGMGGIPIPESPLTIPFLIGITSLTLVPYAMFFGDAGQGRRDF